jgi:hypothetical protein
MPMSLEDAESLFALDEPELSPHAARLTTNNPAAPITFGARLICPEPTFRSLMVFNIT